MANKLPSTLFPFCHHWTIGKFSSICGDWMSGEARIETEIDVGNGGEPIEFSLFPSRHEDFITADIWMDWKSIWMKVSILDSNGEKVYTQEKLDFLPDPSLGKSSSSEDQGYKQPKDYEKKILTIISRSDLLSRSHSLLPQDELTLCIEGVEWDGDWFDVKQSMDWVNAQMSSVVVNTDRFDFHMPTSYCSHKWTIPNIGAYLSKQTPFWSSLKENFQMNDHATFSLELNKIKAVKYGGKFLYASLKLLECKREPITVWYRMAILDAEGKRWEAPFRNKWGNHYDVKMLRKREGFESDKLSGLELLFSHANQVYPSDSLTILCEVAEIVDDNVKESDNAERHSHEVSLLKNYWWLFNGFDPFKLPSYLVQSSSK